ncbi:MAG: DEAD/DEAH box helicase [Aphanocapsa feldmannii 288cV]|nr:MAG: DEAD/DEAH box helicase [Aphanocapsa feldmannii 288cV]
MTGSGRSFALLHSEIQKWVYKQGWLELRPAQVKAIAAIRQGSADLIISAPTAEGKTEAAFLPLLSDLLDLPPSQKGYVFYVGPLKALINDQWQRLEKICNNCHITIVPWHGDVSQSIKARSVEARRAVFLITPESLEAMLVNRASQAKRLFGHAKAVVIDEFHAFVGNDRGEQLLSLLLRLESLSQHRPRRIGLSATLGDPHAVCRAIEPRQADQVAYVESDAGTNRSIKLKLNGYENSFYDPDKDSGQPVTAGDRPLHHKGSQQLQRRNQGLSQSSPEHETAINVDPATVRTASPDPVGLVAGGQPRQDDPIVLITRDIFRFAKQTNLVFPNSRAMVEKMVDIGNNLCREAKRDNIFHAHHGLLSKQIREEVEEQARQGRQAMTICCTTTLELGIDIGSVDSIFQVGPAPSISSLRQRLGRSGRRSSPPILRASVIEDPIEGDVAYEVVLREGLVQTIANITLIGERWYEPPERSGISFCVVAHQVLALIAQRGGASAAVLWAHFSDRATYGLEKQQFIGILHGLSEAELLVQLESGLLHLSAKGEQRTSHYSFYSVFETEQDYQLYAKEQRLGTVPVRSMVAEGEFLLFASRRWQVMSIDNAAKAITVVPALAVGKVPSSTPGKFNVHTKVRQVMREILAGSSEPPYLDVGARQLLRQARLGFQSLGLNDRVLLGSPGGNLTWFPWVGSRTLNGLFLLIQALTEEQPKRSNLDLRCTASALQEAQVALKAARPEELENLLVERLQQDQKVAFPVTGKWSWVLPKPLQLLDSFRRDVDLEEAVNTLLTLQI